MSNATQNEAYFLSAISADHVQSAWDHLSTRDKLILTKRHRGHTLQSIGCELHVTRERVRQLQIDANKGFISRLKRRWRGWGDWSLTVQSALKIVNLHDIGEKFTDKKVAAVFLSLIFKYLGWKPQKKGSVWWLQDLDYVSQVTDKLLFDEPIKRPEWEIYLLESGLPQNYVKYLIDEEILPLETYRNYMIRSRYRRRDRAHVYLLEHGPTHVSELAEALGEKSTRPLDAFMDRQDVFAKVFPGGQWAIAEFADVKYKRAIDAVIDILSNHGPLTQKELNVYMSIEYPVSPSRIQQCLTDFRVGKMPDGRIWLVENGAKKEIEPEPEQPAHMHCSGKIIGIRRQIDDDTIRGSGLMDNRWLAWKLTLHSTPMKKTFAGVNGLPEMSVTRAGSNCQLSSIREAVGSKGLSLGCSIVIILDLANITWDLRHACPGSECGGMKRRH